ncbi:MAG TPA: carboxypeptidase regulatory-like domain-containing protein [Terriglobales bacterium]|nr:carboxypeptidase regulatory-like domain-containing protein [Terriglobales bacterium]
MRLSRSLCALGTTLFAGSLLAQQITGSIRGTISDPSGAVVQAASVTARQAETGLMRTTTSDHAGNYLLQELPVGHYSLEITAKGFRKYLQDGISLNVNETAVIPVRLTLGTEAEQIQVMADAQLIQSTVSSLGDVVEERELLDLPLDGRNFSQLGLLQPGVVPLTPGLQEAGGSLRDGQAYAVNGQRPESNNFLIDGANNVNAVDAGFVLKPPIDAISEFRILTHNANAEFGQNLGSTTNIITRSGTNSFHGAAWEFLRNDAMDASDFSAHAVQPLKQNQFGGTFGGPIVRDRSFFFAYYEGFRNRQGETVNPTVPSLLQREGDFSEMCPASVGGFDANGICKDPNPAHGYQLYNFSTGQPEPVPYNKLIPPLDSIALNILPFYPLPNQGLNTFIATQSLSVDNDQFGLRFDQYLSPADTLSLRYMYSGGPTIDPLSTSGANVPGFPVGEEDRAQNFVVQETHVLSPAVIAVGRFSYLRNKFLYDQHLNHQLPSELGFKYAPTLPEAAGPPFIQVAGFASVGDPITGPRNTYQNTYDVSGSLSWTHSRHEMTFGGGFQRNQINGLQGIASNGFFVFSTFPYNNAFASFLTGQPVFFLQGGGDLSRHIRGKALNFYGQDTYKVNSRLTLNYGLRWELPYPNTELNNRQNLFVPGAHSVVFPTAPAGLLYPGDPGVPAGLIPTQKTAFAPRGGFALDPTGNGKWLVSAAYGIFYEPYSTGQGGPLQDPISAPPYLQTPQVNFPNFADPFNGGYPFGPSFSQPMTLLVISSQLKLPYAQDWNLNLQRAFGNDWLLQIGYVGTTGVRLPRFIEGNPTVYYPGQSTEDNVNQRRLYSGCTLAQPDNCAYGSVGEIASVANSAYNALESSLRKRFGHGLSFLASYTYSKAIDDVSSFNITGSASQPVAGENDLAQNPFDLGAERGRSLFDARHRFVLSYQWSVPFWHQASTWYQHVLGNWQCNGIVTLMSGTPFTVFDPNDVSLQGSAPEISGFSSNRPNLIGNPNSGPKTPQEWFNTSAFQRITPDPNSPVQQFGNEGRNVVQGPGYANWDFSVLKNIRVAEGKELQFRGELFNFLNHTNLRLPISDISSPTFGEINSDVGPRVIQLGLKFLF